MVHQGINSGPSYLLKGNLHSFSKCLERIDANQLLLVRVLGIYINDLQMLYVHVKLYTVFSILLEVLAQADLQLGTYLTWRALGK